MTLDILNAKTGKTVVNLRGLTSSSTVGDVKNAIHSQRKHLYADRQEIRQQMKSKGCKDEDTLSSLNVTPSNGTLYLKDLGPQISWTTVFITEYSGPLFIYLWVYTRPWLFYGDTQAPYSLCTNVAAACYTVHYTKRVLETIFIHRFSHGTMPIFNLFKNCSYYWGFTAYVAYHVNHPLFTPPSDVQMYAALAAFIVCELGNFSVHLTLRNLRPAGSKVRKIPYPDSNPLTCLFNFVSCPNYFYETGAWFSFTIMTQCLPAGLFMFAGFYQMAVWALGKHRSYKKEFKDYPKQRKAIIPFVL